MFSNRKLENQSMAKLRRGIPTNAAGSGDRRGKICEIALNYAYTKKENLIKLFEKVTDVFIDRLLEDYCGELIVEYKAQLISVRASGINLWGLKFKFCGSRLDTKIDAADKISIMNITVLNAKKRLQGVK